MGVSEKYQEIWSWNRYPNFLVKSSNFNQFMKNCLSINSLDWFLFIYTFFFLLIIEIIGPSGKYQVENWRSLEEWSTSRPFFIFVFNFNVLCSISFQFRDNWLLNEFAWFFSLCFSICMVFFFFFYGPSLQIIVKMGWISLAYLELF